MRSRLLFTIAAVSLVLAGCSSQPDASVSASPPTGKETHAPVASASPSASATSTVEAAAVSPTLEASGQDWADSKIQAWLDNSGIKSVKGFYPPNNLMISWSSSEPGHLEIVLDNSYRFNQDGMLQSYERPTDELRIMGLVMFESIGEQSPELESVTFATKNGKYSGSYSRARTGADPDDRDAWAEEKYVQWLDSMNDTYESFCGATIKKLETYRSCIPTDPHAYIDSVESPDFGELVVTLSPGIWQDNTYDTKSLPGVNFVSGNMMLKINSKAHGNEQVEKLTVVVEGSDETSTEFKNPPMD